MFGGLVTTNLRQTKMKVEYQNSTPISDGVQDEHFLETINQFFLSRRLYHSGQGNFSQKRRAIICTFSYGTKNQADSQT
jgi:hypothetical protein